MTAIEDQLGALIWLEFTDVLSQLRLKLVGPDGNGVARLTTNMGWRIQAFEDVDPEPMLDALDVLRETVLNAVADPGEQGSAVSAATAEAAVDRVGDELYSLFESFVPALQTAAGGALDPAIRQSFVVDLVEYLAIDWLVSRARPLALVGEALGLLRWESPAAIWTGGADPKMVRLPIERRSLPLLQIVAAALDPISLLAGDGVTGEATMQALEAELQRILDGIHRRLAGAAAGDLELRLTPESIEIVGFEPPLYELPGGTTDGAPPIRIALPTALLDPSGSGAAPDLSIIARPDSLGLAWDIDSIVGSTPAGTGESVLLDVDGFRLIVGSPPTATDTPASLTLSPPVDDSSGPTIVASGGLRLELPGTWLASDAGTTLSIGAAGTLTAATSFAPDGTPGVELDIALDQVTANVSGLRLGGDAGLLVESATVTLTDVQFPALTTPGLIVDGQVRLGGALVGVTASLNDTGFRVTSTAVVDLDGGVRFEPVGDLPVLDFVVPFGGGSITAALSGTVRLPKGDGLESVTFVGSLAVDATPNGLVVQAVSAAAEVTGTWVMAGGVTVKSASAALVYDAGSETFAVELGGEVKVGKGVLVLDHARFGFSPAAVTLDVSVTASNIEFDEMARLRSGTVTVNVIAPTDGSPGAGTLAVNGGAADFVRSDGEWLVTLDDLVATVAVDDRFRLDLVSGMVSFPVPFDLDNPNTRAAAQVDSFVFEADTSAVTLDGGFSLATELPLWSSGGFRVSVHAGSAFRIALGPDRAPMIGVDGGVRFEASRDALRNVDGVEQVSIAIAGTTTLVLGDSPRIDFSGVDLTLGPGTFQLGDTDAMRLSNATIELRRIERLTDPTPDDPFEIALTGRLQVDDNGPALSITEATFVFEGDLLPRFQTGGIGVEAGDFADDLPFRVTAASFELVDPTLAFPASIEPSNLRIGASVGLDLPIGGSGGAGVMARADQVEVDLSGPLPTITLDGIGMGVDGLTLGVLEVSGLLYVGGLGALADLPAAITGGAPPGQRPLFLAGKLGGRYNGTRLVVLVAMRPDKPLGVCLDVAIDGGITLLYGFTLNGASGGVSFANTPGNPCDIRSYIDYAASPPAASETDWTEEPGEHSFDGATAVTPETGCDCNCPPPSMNPLCQPHPDGAAFPGRAILKFSAISEQMLDDWGLLPILDDATSDAQTMIAAVIDGVRDGLSPMVPALPDTFPLPAGTPPELVEIARRPVNAVVEPLHERLLALAADGVADFRTHLLDTLWAGIECPDITLQVTGTFSYTGVGYFLTVTGGVNIGTTGAGGVIGSVNLFGIPIGTLRAFISGTDDQGMPRTGLCGDLDVSFGPFDLGRLCVTMSVPSLETVLFEAAVEHLPRLLTIGGQHATGLLEGLLETVELDPVTSPGTLAERIARVDPDDAAGIVTALASGGLDAIATTSAGAASDPEMIAWLGDLMVTLWEGYDPSLSACGVVQPKIFGFPLISELATLSVAADKQRFTATTTFSAGQLIATLFGGSGAFLTVPTDYVTLSVSCGFPDPVGAGIQTFLEIGQNRADPAQQLIDQVADEVDRLLEQALFAVGLSIRPFGLELADAQSRIVLPELLNYPANSWAPPDDRSAVLDAALDADLIVDPNWTGDLAAVPGLGTSHAGHDLRADYFPHGGWMGAGHLSLPRLLTDPPPIELIGRIFDNDDILDRLGAISSFVGEWITQTTQIGTMSFYVPAPAPPVGLEGSFVEQLGQMGEHAALGGIRSDLFFASGELTLSLFGVDLGTAHAAVELPGPGEPGHLEVTSRLGGGWLADLVGTIDVTAKLTAPPPLPLGLYFGVVEQLVGLAASGKLTRPRLDAAIASAAIAHVDDPAHREMVRALLGDVFAGVGTGGSIADRQAALAEAIGSTVAEMLPKFALEGHAEGLDLPEPLAGLFSIQSARVAAYSPWFDPTAGDDDLLGAIKRSGGVAVEVIGATVNAFGWSATIDSFVASVRGGPGGVPLVDVSAQASGVDVPGLEFDDAHLVVSNDGLARAELTISGSDLVFGWGRLKPVTAGPTTSKSVVRLAVDLLNGTAALDSSRLVPASDIGIASAEVVLHGADGDGSPFTFDRDGPWSAAARVDSLELDLPGGGDPWRASNVAKVVIEGHGLSLRELSGRLDLAVDTVGPLRLLGVELFPSIDVGVDVTLHATVSGLDGPVSAVVAGSLAWQGQQLSFDSSTPVGDAASMADLHGMVLNGVLTAFERLFVSFDMFVAAVNGGWVTLQFDPVRLGQILTRVYGVTGVSAVTSALVQLELTPSQVGEVLRTLFSWTPHGDLALIPHGDGWIGTIDTSLHGDAVITPHGDAEIGLHADGVIHGDLVAGHADIASEHADSSATAHLDASPELHGDVNAELHGDASGVGHVDTPHGPHGDGGFSPFHGDGYVPPHGDVSGAHVDVTAVPHADVAASAHGDVSATAHVDVSTPHLDGAAPPPHGDSQTHADVDPVHIDGVETHVDEVVHADEPGVHVDFAAAGHIDSGAGYRDLGGDGGHGDAPALPHVDRAAIPHGDSTASVPWHVDSPTRRHGDVPGGGDLGRSPIEGRRGRIIPAPPDLRARERTDRGTERRSTGSGRTRGGEQPPEPRRAPELHQDLAVEARTRIPQHVDRAAEPHGDRPLRGPHIDVAAAPHADRAAEPHGDSP